jgi:hypothetical protein
VSLDSSRLAPQAPDSSFGTSRACAGVPSSCAEAQERAALADHGLNSLRSGPRDGLHGHDHVYALPGNKATMPQPTRTDRH